LMDVDGGYKSTYLQLGGPSLQETSNLGQRPFL
jgi:hypothetical protein